MTEKRGAKRPATPPKAPAKKSTKQTTHPSGKIQVAACGVEAVVTPHARKEPFGRPTDYRPEFARIAAAMCKMGATDCELAHEFGVSTFTIWNWRSKYEDFSNALKEGKDAFDDRIERSLAMKACGYSFHSEKLFCYEGNVTRADVIEHVPPDVGAIKLWLINRRPDQWRDKVQAEVSGAITIEQLVLGSYKTNADE